MKRIIGGVIYDTEASTAVARLTSEADDFEPKSKVHTLYQTRDGGFFLHKRESWIEKGHHSWREKQSDHFLALNGEEAYKWIMQGEKEIFTNVFEGETMVEATASAAIFLRVPTALKERIEKAARLADQSVNMWVVRRLEECTSSTEADCS
jgi:predicted HicB family RNase H-like nuclease